MQAGTAKFQSCKYFPQRFRGGAEGRGFVRAVVDCFQGAQLGAKTMTHMPQVAHCCLHFHLGNIAVSLGLLVPSSIHGFIPRMMLQPLHQENKTWYA